MHTVKKSYVNWQKSENKWQNLKQQKNGFLQTSGFA